MAAFLHWASVAAFIAAGPEARRTVTSRQLLGDRLRPWGSRWPQPPARASVGDHGCKECSDERYNPFEFVRDDLPCRRMMNNADVVDISDQLWNQTERKTNKGDIDFAGRTYKCCCAPWPGTCGLFNVEDLEFGQCQQKTWPNLKAERYSKPRDHNTCRVPLYNLEDIGCEPAHSGTRPCKPLFNYTREEEHAPVCKVCMDPSKEPAKNCFSLTHEAELERLDAIQQRENGRIQTKALHDERAKKRAAANPNPASIRERIKAIRDASIVEADHRAPPPEELAAYGAFTKQEKNFLSLPGAFRRFLDVYDRAAAKLGDSFRGDRWVASRLLDSVRADKFNFNEDAGQRAAPLDWRPRMVNQALADWHRRLLEDIFQPLCNDTSEVEGEENQARGTEVILEGHSTQTRPFRKSGDFLIPTLKVDDVPPLHNYELVGMIVALGNVLAAREANVSFHPLIYQSLALGKPVLPPVFGTEHDNKSSIEECEQLKLFADVDARQSSNATYCSRVIQECWTAPLEHMIRGFSKFVDVTTISSKLNSPVRGWELQLLVEGERAMPIRLDWTDKVIWRFPTTGVDHSYESGNNTRIRDLFKESVETLSDRELRQLFMFFTGSPNDFGAWTPMIEFTSDDVDGAGAGCPPLRSKISKRLLKVPIACLEKARLSEFTATLKDNFRHSDYGLL